MVWNKRVVNPHDVINGIEIVREVENKKERTRVEVICPYCGNLFTTDLSHIISKHTKSCGCQQYKGRRIGADSNLFVHGLSHHPLHIIWSSMRARCGVIQGCNKKTLKNYAERGIIVCDEWRDDFMAFYNWAIAHGWRKGLQLDRKNNELGYSPENCHFVTRSQNLRNRRNTLRLGTGEPLIDYLERYNVPIYTNDGYSKWSRRYRRDLREAGCVQGFLFPLNAR